MEKLLSIIIPAYNMEAYLDRCIESCIVDDSALIPRLEILVVNDGSQDNTLAIGHAWAHKYPGVVRVLDKPNGNYGSCINVALPLCRGIFVRVLDADDFHVRQYLQDLLAVLAKIADSTVDLVLTRFQVVTATGTIVSVSPELPIRSETPFCLNELPDDIKRFDLHMMTYRLKRLNGMHYRQTEGVSYSDTEWITTPLACVRKALYTPVIVTNYLLGRDGQTMVPSTFTKNFQQVCNIVIGIVRQYEANRAFAEPTSLSCYRSQLLKSVFMVYQHLILQHEELFYAGDLRSFDDAIATSSHEIYLASDAFLQPSRTFPCRMVHWYRKWKSRYHPMLLAYRIYLRLARHISALYPLLKPNR